MSRAILVVCGGYEEERPTDLPVEELLDRAIPALVRAGLSRWSCGVVPEKDLLRQGFSGDLLVWCIGRAFPASALRALSHQARLTVVIDGALDPRQGDALIVPSGWAAGTRVLVSLRTWLTLDLVAVLGIGARTVPEILRDDNAFIDMMRLLRGTRGDFGMASLVLPPPPTRPPDLPQRRLMVDEGGSYETGVRDRLSGYSGGVPRGRADQYEGGMASGYNGAGYRDPYEATGSGGGFGRWEPEESNARHINAEFADGATGLPVPGWLEPHTRYTLDVDIGPARRTAIRRADREPFPSKHLPPSDVGWWLDVGLSSADVSCDPAYQRLFLGVIGPAFSCDCDPLFSHTCGPSQRHAGRVRLAFTTGEPGRVRLQLAIYYETAAVQVLRISASVGGAAPISHLSEVVFSLNRDLDALSRYAGRSASIVSASGDSGRHHLALNDGQGHTVGFELLEAQAATAARELRHELFDIHLQRSAAGGWRSRYGPRFERPPDEFLRDLHRLALAGREAYVALFPDAGARRGLRQRLAGLLALGRTPVIQVARASGSRIAVPWQALYELPVPADPGSAAVCPSVSGGQCPYETGASHPGDRGVLCPFGFWGYSYVLEIPPWSAVGDLAVRTGDTWPATVLLAANESVIAPVWSRHHGELARICGVEKVPTAMDSMTLRRSGRDGVDLLYFLCHGVRIERSGVGAPKPALELRPDDRITPQDLADWAELHPPVQWARRRPLVLLNGCHTGEVLPDTLTDFVSAFVGSLGAAGVLATEIAIDRDLACHAMEQLIGFLWEGDGVGTALLRLRRLLLRRGNLMGLAYSPYCDATLQLPPKSEGFTWQAARSSSASAPPASA